MTTAGEIICFLAPDVEYTISGTEYENIVWHSGKPAFTKEQFEDGFAQYDAWKAEQEAAKSAKKAAAEAKLVALGLDIDDLKALGLG